MTRYKTLLFIAGMLIFYWPEVKSQSSKNLSFVPREIVTGKLPNGITYYIAENKKPQNRAEYRLVVKSGSCEESEDQSGLAHFTEHMAFNGTKSFKKNDLINYLELQGTKFGPHLNAYTSFDETVYMFRLPSDNDSVFKKGIEILYDWSVNLSFDSLEIEKERGVVIEEWRLGQGADERMRRKYWPVLFGNSRYASRLPIGRKENLEKFKHSSLKDYYFKWYKPENQAIIIVGDIDARKTEEELIKVFEKRKASSVNIFPPVWQVEDHKGITASICTDEEASGQYVELIYKLPHLKIQTIENFKEMLKRELINEIISSRMNDERKKPDAAFTGAYGGYGTLVNNKDAIYWYAMCKKGQVSQSISFLAHSIKEITEQGCLKLETERAKESLINSAKQRMMEKDKRQSGAVASALVDCFIDSSAFIEPEYYFKLTDSLLSVISQSDLNKYVKSTLSSTSDNLFMLIVSPESEKSDLPDEKTAIETFKKSLLDQVALRTDEDVKSLKIIKSNPVKGKIVKTGMGQIHRAAGDEKADSLQYYECSNGVKVYFKKTKFDNDIVYFSALAPGGNGNFTESEYNRSWIMTSLLSESGVGQLSNSQLSKKMQGINAQVYPIISENRHGVGGSSTNKDLEFAFQLIHARLTEIRRDSAAFRLIKSQIKNHLDLSGNDPNEVYRDSMNYFLSGYHFQSRPKKTEDLDKTDYNFCLEKLDEIMLRNDSLIFLFTGSINDTLLYRLTEQYIASIPIQKGNNSYFEKKRNYPLAAAEKIVKKGKEDIASVSLVLNGYTEYSKLNKTKLSLLISVLNIRLRESLREDKSGVYGVGARASVNKKPLGYYTITISFSCAPNRYKELTEAVLTEINSLKEGQIKDTDLEKAKQSVYKENESNLKENRYWHRVLSNAIYDEESLKQELEITDMVKLISKEDLTSTALEHFKTTGLKQIILLPE